jgi:hypothetical protein
LLIVLGALQDIEASMSANSINTTSEDDTTLTDMSTMAYLNTSWEIHNERAFTLFPNLPKELRLQIWEHALPPPRIVTFGHPSSPSLDTFKLYQLAYETYPCLDEVRQESWKVLSSNLHRLHHERSITTGRTIQISLTRGVISRAQYQEEGIGHYYNCSRDTLMLSPGLIYDCKTAGILLDLSPVRHLALHRVTEIGDGKSSWETARSTCSSLKSFTIISSPTHPTNGVWFPETARLVQIDPSRHTYIQGWNYPGYVADAEHYWEYFKKTVLVEDSSWMSIKFQVAFVSWEKVYNCWVGLEARYTFQFNYGTFADRTTVSSELLSYFCQRNFLPKIFGL